MTIYSYILIAIMGIICICWLYFLFSEYRRTKENLRTLDEVEAWLEKCNKHLENGELDEAQTCYDRADQLLQELKDQE